MKSKVRILHLSDIHLHDPSSQHMGKIRGNKKEVFEAFLKSDFTDSSTGQVVDLVLITGDIYDGLYINSVTNDVELEKIKEYGKSFFDHLSKICNNSNILFCYGNHDLNLYFQPELSGVFSSQRFHYSALNKDIPSLLTLFTAYYNSHIKHNASNLTSNESRDFEDLDNQGLLNYYVMFIQKFITDKNFTFLGITLKELEKLLFNNLSEGLPFFRSHYGFEDFYTFGVVFFEKLNVIVAIFNTSWQNVNSELLDGRLSLGEYQVDKIEQSVKEITKTHTHAYVITLMHNAFNSLGYPDVHNTKLANGSFISRISKFSDLILCGHEHGELPPSLMHLECYLLKTGGLLNNDSHSPRNSYSIIELDFEKRELTRNLYVYDNQQIAFSLLRVTRDGLCINNYYQFELYPKKAQKYFVAQQRDIEEYLEYFKEFKVDYTINSDESGLDGYNFSNDFKQALSSSPNSAYFFDEKDRIIRKAILHFLTHNPLKMKN